MAFLEKNQVLNRFRSEATNSSHFVWLLAEMKYYECENGWIFAFTQIGDVTLFALEPLIPGSPVEYGPEHVDAFQKAWAEFTQIVEVKISAFVAVYDPFNKLLKQSGYNSIKVGQEPWVNLNDCIPKGNSGKGVRSARNQALLAGLKVEEWSHEEIASDPKKRAVMTEIYQDWKSHRLVNLDGFMSTVDPFAYMSDRRYFVLRSQKRIEAYLIATPVPGINSYYLEDMALRQQTPRGTGELLTLEAMIALGEAGANQSSLGVVSISKLDAEDAKDLPPLAKFLMVTLPKYISPFYNFAGMEVYRKRFKPHVWKNINLAVKNDQPGLSASMAWLKVLIALVIAFKPRLQISRKWLTHVFVRPVLNRPLTFSFALVTTFLFAKINHFGALPHSVLQNFGFSANITWTDWIHRSIISDFLHFDKRHFLASAVPTMIILYWAEKTHPRNFIIPFFFFCSVFDDITNYWVLIKPFQHFHPAMFSDMIAYKDVGSSLILMTFVGLQLCQFKFLREPLFALIMLSSVLAFAFTSAHLQWLIMNLNHAVFFVLGFLAGKARFEYQRHLSRLASKRKPPIARCVAPQAIKKAA
jgi:hypothetical protein